METLPIIAQSGATRQAEIIRIVEDCDDLICHIVKVNYPEVGIWPHTRVRSAIREAIREASNLSQSESNTDTN